jgi:hypothetical protein
MRGSLVPLAQIDAKQLKLAFAPPSVKLCTTSARRSPTICPLAISSHQFDSSKFTRFASGKPRATFLSAIINTTHSSSIISGLLEARACRKLRSCHLKNAFKDWLEHLTFKIVERRKFSVTID